MSVIDSSYPQFVDFILVVVVTIVTELQKIIANNDVFICLTMPPSGGEHVDGGEEEELQ